MDRVTLQKFKFTSDAGQQYPREFISRRGAVKLSEDEQEVRVAVVDGSGEDVFEYLEGFHLPKKVVFFSVGKAEFASFIGETTDIEPLSSVPGQASPEDSYFALDTITQDAPVINIINSICIDAIRLEASDIHIEAQADSVHIRYRIDGILRIVKKIDRSLFHSISNRIKIMADMNTMEQRLPQDGRMTVAVENTAIDLRVSVIPVTNGESIVLRIFNKSTKRLGLDELGFFPADLERISAGIRQPYGLILLTGPTGSGKTTTLHALLGTLPVSDLKIITIEDPVEQLIPGINQVQINDAIQLSFEGMLRRVLRQDPNVIMVGEIRDGETAELAVRSALTGHLILSTLHTNDSISVIARLENMGLEPYLIAAVLRCSVAQRLVRRVCPSCRKEVKLPGKVRSLYTQYGIEGTSMFEPAGCGECGYSGYKGRTVVSEVFTADPAAEEMIVRRAPAAEILRYARDAGMEIMAQDALRKVAAGITTFSEAEREVLF
ncbi:GspE/PulE family protein [Breznakiella homolactica]|uniref:Type II/IV secretion system protein n=1 Tax=Breznakiella homolactica TaxID=2798577 RepID=A0A7T7XQQ7_9SPIR|nr:GspE/PulE family protein [Breznakiella homolactica]QQO10741.1 GspE/PulE family protein [Breznakiella homolactica]